MESQSVKSNFQICFAGFSCCNSLLIVLRQPALLIPICYIRTALCYCLECMDSSKFSAWPIQHSRRTQRWSAVVNWPIQVHSAPNVCICSSTRLVKYFGTPFIWHGINRFYCYQFYCLSNYNWRPVFTHALSSISWILTKNKKGHPVHNLTSLY